MLFVNGFMFWLGQSRQTGAGRQCSLARYSFDSDMTLTQVIVGN
jgi:hypothetical protein